MSGRIDFATRLQRLLAVLRYAAARPEGVSHRELADEFGLTTDQLVIELELASMIGADAADYHEMPFEVVLDDDLVFVRLFALDEPLRLTPQEGLLLVAAAESLAGTEADDSPLRRALAKVAVVLGIEPGESVDVDADPYGGAAGRLLDEAVARRRRVRFGYWSYARDEIGTRVVEPWAVFAADGAWYLVGADVDAGEPRRFRLDRTWDLEVLEDEAARPPARVDRSLSGLEGGGHAVLDLPSEARWVVEHVPTTSVEVHDDGRLTVELAVADRVWLERLLLRVGPGARVVDLDDRLGAPDVLAGAARRILARYRERGGVGAPG